MLCPIRNAAPAELVSTEQATLARFPEESLLFGSAKADVQNGLEYYHRYERIAGIVQTRLLWNPLHHHLSRCHCRGAGKKAKQFH